MPILSSGPGNLVTIDGKEYLFFAGNNYLGLAGHPAVKRAALEAVESHGLSSSASRETTGTSVLHVDLERQLADFKNQADAVIFSTGYLGNRILLHALRNRFTTVLADRLSHPSVLDGVPREIGEIVFYDHGNTDHLADLLAERPGAGVLIITDGVFALTGEIAPLDRIYRLARKHGAVVVVDDAHATGILGEHGRGTPEHFGLDDAENLYQTEMLSKALGCFGGFIAADRETIRNIRTGSAAYIGTTALPPPIAAAGSAALRYLREHPERRLKVLENARTVKEGLNRLNLPTAPDDTPIIPVFFDTPGEAGQLSSYLRGQGIIAPAVRYPVPMDRYPVRITVSADHTGDHLNTLLEALESWRNRHDTQTG
jgi:7-keto-8-aminopelargonate synthetase-like enzyme